MFHAQFDPGDASSDPNGIMVSEAYPAQIHYLPSLPGFSPKEDLDMFLDDDVLMFDATLADDSFNGNDVVMSNTDMELTSLPPPSNYPSTEDWIAYCPIIARLYRDESKPLKEVMSIMRDRYGFNGT